MTTRVLSPANILRAGLALLGALAALAFALIVTTQQAGAQEESKCDPGADLVCTLVCPAKGECYYDCSCEASENPDDECDYGRNPVKLWVDNPDGYPFERKLCDGAPGSPPASPYDSPENEDLYCNQVPECLFDFCNGNPVCIGLFAAVGG